MPDHEVLPGVSALELVTRFFGELRSQIRELVMQEYAAQARQTVRLSD